MWIHKKIPTGILNFEIIGSLEIGLLSIAKIIPN